MTTKPIAPPQGIPSPLPPPPSGRRTRLTVLPDPPRPLDMQQQLPYLSNTFIILDDHFADRPDVGVGGEGYLCLDARDYPGAPRPDCLVVIDAPVPPAEILASNGYVINEIGKAPDFVLEIASESTGRRDYVEKPAIYAGFGVREYWRFDHTGGQYHNAALAGDRMIAGRYQPIPIRVGIDGVWRGYCAVLDLELHWYEKRLWFWIRPQESTCRIWERPSSSGTRLRPNGMPPRPSGMSPSSNGMSPKPGLPPRPVAPTRPTPALTMPTPAPWPNPPALILPKPASLTLPRSSTPQPPASRNWKPNWNAATMTPDPDVTAPQGNRIWAN